MKKLTQEWVQRAETCYEIAAQSSRSSKTLHDGVCRYSHWCAESYLKALQQESGLPVRRMPDLDHLLTDLTPHHPSLTTLRRGLLLLDKYAVDVGYPGQTRNKRQAASALRWANKVRTAARSLLGIRQPRKPRKKTP
jgi:HEPN domain-containing protein